MGLFTRRSKATGPAIDLRAEPVIDLTAVAPAKATVEWGFPTRCPECGDYGYLDRIDVVNEVMHQHCPTCWAKWDTHRSDTIGA